MRFLLSLMVSGLVATSLFGAGDICVRPDGCRIDITSGECIDCIKPDDISAPKSCLDERSECIDFHGEVMMCETILMECRATEIAAIKFVAISCFSLHIV